MERFSRVETIGFDRHGQRRDRATSAPSCARSSWR
ncbi:MAG: hypothetical protein U1E19_10065 [Rhodoblastus sp.]